MNIIIQKTFTNHDLIKKLLIAKISSIERIYLHYL